MALTHSGFEKFPLQIAGISKSEGTGESKVYLYDTIIAAIEDFVTEDMAYSGSVEVGDVLPYFVYFYFGQDCLSTMTANAGENVKIDKVAQPSIDKQVKAWNLGVVKLRNLLGITTDLINARAELFECKKVHAIIEDLGISINEHYLQKISLL